MRIAPTAATLVLVLAAAGCGTTSPTEPDGSRSRPEPARTEAVSPGSAAPLRSGNMMGSGY